MDIKLGRRLCDTSEVAKPKTSGCGPVPGFEENLRENEARRLKQPTESLS